jgi:hypothetical protein
MPAKIPLVVTREGPDLTVEIDGQAIKMICDTSKWACHFGLSNSGTVVRLTFKPK